MNVVTSLESMGLVVRIDDAGDLSLSGLRSLSAKDRRAAVDMAKENKPAIMEELRRRSCMGDEPTPGQITHARRLLVACPVQGRKLHCWYCSRCSETRTCAAWRTRRADVEFFRRSGEPYSLYLAEEAKVVLQ